MLTSNISCLLIQDIIEGCPLRWRICYNEIANFPDQISLNQNNQRKYNTDGLAFTSYLLIHFPIIPCLSISEELLKKIANV